MRHVKGLVLATRGERGVIGVNKFLFLFQIKAWQDSKFFGYATRSICLYEEQATNDDALQVVPFLWVGERGSMSTLERCGATKSNNATKASPILMWSSHKG
jgi:hypothetical protein